MTYHSTTTIPIEADIITPDQLAGKTPLQIAKLPIQHGNAQVPLGEFFHAAGDATDQQISIEGDCSRVKLIGALMKSGRITIHGNAGMHLGAEIPEVNLRLMGKRAIGSAPKCAAV